MSENAVVAPAQETGGVPVPLGELMQKLAAYYQAAMAAHDPAGWANGRTYRVNHEAEGLVVLVRNNVPDVPVILCVGFSDLPGGDALAPVVQALGRVEAQLARRTGPRVTELQRDEHGELVRAVSVPVEE